eukprot:1327461-Amorphochlora_amoeboformis.AAC.1
MMDFGTYGSETILVYPLGRAARKIGSTPSAVACTHSSFDAVSYLLSLGSSTGHGKERVWGLQGERREEIIVWV